MGTNFCYVDQLHFFIDNWFKPPERLKGNFGVGFALSLPKVFHKAPL